jgi:hypothetical protein
MSIIGSSLEAVRRDLKYMPTQTLVQYKQNPAKNAVDGIPLDMLAGLELSRRAQMQTELAAAGAQNAANMPTVTDAAAQQLTGQPQQPPAPMPQGAPQPAPQQAQPPRPQVPQQPIPPTAAQVQQGPMQQTAQGGLPTVKKAQGGFIIDSPDDLYNLINGKRNLLKTEGYAGGGIIAFNGEKRSNVPDAYEGMTQEEIDRAVERSLGMSTMPNPRAASAKRQLEMRQAMGEGTFFGTKKDESKGQKQIPVDNAASTPGLPPPSELALTEGLRKLYSTPTGGGVKSNFKVPDIKVPDLPNRSVANAQIESLANETAEASNARMALKNFAADLERRKSPFMTDAEKTAAEDVQFKKRQEIYDPVNAETQRVLDERRAALEERRGRRLSEAGLQLGLGMLGGRGNLASIISGAGKEAVGVYQKGRELDDAQNERIQDMRLKQQQALAAQKAGNMDLAYQRTREAQADKLAIDNFEVARQKDALTAQQKAAEIAETTRGRQMTAAVHLDKVQNALDMAKLGYDMSSQLAEAKFNMQLELHRLQSANVDLGRQLQLASFLEKIRENERKAEAARLPTPEGLASIYKLVDQDFSTSPGLLDAGIAKLGQKGAQLVADYRRNPNDPTVAAAYGEAARRVRDLAAKEKLSGTRTPGAPMSMGEAEAAVK